MTAEKPGESASEPRPSHSAFASTATPSQGSSTAGCPQTGSPVFEEAGTWERTFDAMTEKNRAEEAMVASEVRYRRLFEAAKDGILILDAETGTILDANPFLVELLGYSHEQFVGKRVWELGFFKDVAASQANFAELQRQEYIRYEDLPLETANGRRVNVEFVSNVYLVDHQKVIQCNIRDITDRKRAEAELRESEKLYRSLFENLLNGFAYCRMLFEDGKPKDFIYLAVNDAFESQTGLKDVVGRKVTEVIPGIREADPQLFEIYGRVAMSGQHERFEMFIKALQMWFLISVYSPAPEHFAAVFDVITERKRAEEALRESAERFRITFDQSPVGKAIVSLDYRFVRVNEMLCRITGYSSEELTRLHFPEITHPDDLAEDLQLTRRMVAGEIDQYEMDKRYLRKDGGVVWIHLIVRLARTASGQPLYFLPTIQDISERKLAEEAMRRSEKIQAEAEKLAATGRMAARIAHEINNPLAGIKNAFRLIRDAVPQDHPDRDMVGRIEREIDRIGRVVQQMYQLYSPQAQTPREIDVGEAIRDVLAMLEPLCRQHEVTVEMGPVPAQLRAWVPDGSLQQILYNLTVNAIKASTPGGSVNISAKRADNSFVTISIRDQGHGIPVELQDRVFEPFFSADVEGSTTQGLGLGLSIVKSIVTSVGGRIEFETTVGKGTCFQVHLPSKQS